MIVVTILVCVFVETTYVAFPSIVDNNVIKWFQICSLVVFLFEFGASMVMVRMVEGKKLITIGAIFKDYCQDGMLMDFAYLVVLVVDLVADAAWFRLIILLKLP